MSIYIKGMEMPSSCLHCDFADEFGDCCCKDTEPYECEFDKHDSRPDWCPLIELPPHGRLGDLDALFLAMFQCTDGSIIGDKDIDGWPFEARYADIKRFIRQAPTIIPADLEGGADG